MNNNTAGPHLARLRFASLLSYPPLVFDCGSSDSRSFMKVLISVSTLIPRFAFPPLLVGTRLGAHQSRAHPALAHGGSDTTHITNPTIALTLSFGTIQDPGILEQVTCLFASRFLSLYNPFVVHFSTPTLLFFAALLCRISPFYSLFRPLSLAPKFSCARIPL